MGRGCRVSGLELGELFESGVVEEQAFAEHAGGDGECGRVAVSEHDRVRGRVLDLGGKVGPVDPHLSDERPEGVESEVDRDAFAAVGDDEVELDRGRVGHVGGLDADREGGDEHERHAAGDAPQPCSEAQSAAAAHAGEPIGASEDAAHGWLLEHALQFAHPLVFAVDLVRAWRLGTRVWCGWLRIRAWLRAR